MDRPSTTRGSHSRRSGRTRQAIGTHPPGGDARGDGGGPTLSARAAEVRLFGAPGRMLLGILLGVIGIALVGMGVLFALAAPRWAGLPNVAGGQPGPMRYQLTLFKLWSLAAILAITGVGLFVQAFRGRFQ